MVGGNLTEALALVGLICAALVIVLILRRQRRGGGLRKVPDRFETVALRTGGKVVAERLIAGELKRGAVSRHGAIEKALDKLDRDRRSWR